MKNLFKEVKGKSDCYRFRIKQKRCIPGDANLSLACAPENDSKFINNFTGDIRTWARDGITCKHKGGGSTIELHTFTGDNTVGDQ